MKLSKESGDEAKNGFGSSDMVLLIGSVVFEENEKRTIQVGTENICRWHWSIT